MSAMIFLLFFVLAVIGRVAMQYKISGDHGIRPLNKASTRIAVASSTLLLMSFTSIFILTILDTIEALERLIEYNQAIASVGTVIGLPALRKMLRITGKHFRTDIWHHQHLHVLAPE